MPVKNKINIKNIDIFRNKGIASEMRSRRHGDGGDDDGLDGGVVDG